MPQTPTKSLNRQWSMASSSPSQARPTSNMHLCQLIPTASCQHKPPSKHRRAQHLIQICIPPTALSTPWRSTCKSRIERTYQHPLRTDRFLDIRAHGLVESGKSMWTCVAWHRGSLSRGSAASSRSGFKLGREPTEQRSYFARSLTSRLLIKLRFSHWTRNCHFDARGK